MKTTVFIKDTTSSWLSRSGSVALRIKPHSYFSKTKTSIPIGSPGSVCAIAMVTGMWISWLMMVSVGSSSGRMTEPAHFGRDKRNRQPDESILIFSQRTTCTDRTTPYIIAFWNFPYPWASTQRPHCDFNIRTNTMRQVLVCHYHNGYAISMRDNNLPGLLRERACRENGGL